MDWYSTGLASEGPDRWWVTQVDGTPVVLARDQGVWQAVEDRCSHAGCAFSTDGELDGATLICNCHGSEFDLRTGEVVAMPARSPIRTFRTRVVDGMVEVEL